MYCFHVRIELKGKILNLAKIRCMIALVLLLFTKHNINHKYLGIFSKYALHNL